MTLSRRTILTSCAVIYLLAQLAFLIGIQFPRGHNFDEFHYVPSAKQFLELKDNQNKEHPPLGKLILAGGIAVWGDRPIGWRFTSTLFGALTLVGMYLWGLALFKDQKKALWVVGVTFANNLLFVQSRIGMLDTFMFAFLAFAAAAYTAVWDPALDYRKARRLLVFAGAMFGLAAATKWFSIMPWFFSILLIAIVRLFQYWKMGFAEPKAGDWYSPTLWKGIRNRDFAGALIGVGLFCYFLTFLPYYFIPGNTLGPLDLLWMQGRMYSDQLRVTTNHPYMSSWPSWPLILRPIWYAFDKEGANKEFVRGVLLVGNPLVMWFGLVAMIDCLVQWVRTRAREPFLIVAFYAMFYLCWMMIPRKIAFYYYYYPAGMTLGLALCYCLWRVPAKAARWVFLGATVALFGFFYPILAAVKIPSETFSYWTWFRSWI